MSVLIEKVDDEFYVNPMAVDSVEIEHNLHILTNSSRVVIFFRSGRTIARRWETHDEAVETAKRWQRLLNTGETA